MSRARFAKVEQSTCIHVQIELLIHQVLPLLTFVLFAAAVHDDVKGIVGALGKETQSWSFKFNRKTCCTWAKKNWNLKVMNKINLNEKSHVEQVHVCTCLQWWVRDRVKIDACFTYHCCLELDQFGIVLLYVTLHSGQEPKSCAFF